MHVLITNDDGVDSPGIHTLAKVAVDLGLTVTVGAPSWDSSGASASLTSVQSEGKVLIEERRIEGLDPKAQVFAVEAAPAFIAFLAAGGGFGEPPDLVLSGINRGANTGQVVLHSGTVGAALTARTHGLPAIAFSLDVRGVRGDDDLHWDTAAAVAHRVIGATLEGMRPMVLNVNVPDVPLVELRGLRRAHLASQGQVQATVTEVGSGYVKLTYDQPSAVDEPGSDAALLADGYATFTPLRTVCEADDVSGLLDLVGTNAGIDALDGDRDGLQLDG